MSVADSEDPFFDTEDDDDDLWDEVVPDSVPGPSVPGPSVYDLVDLEEPTPAPSINITISAKEIQRGKGKDVKGWGISHAERKLRVDVHKMHTVALLLNAQARNRWLNDELLQARLISLTPLAIQDSLALIHKSRIPDAAKRGTMFELTIKRLVDWWSGDFFRVLDSGHLRSRTYEDVHAALIFKGFLERNLVTSGTGEPSNDVEPLKSSKAKGKQKVSAPRPDWLDFLSDDEDVEVIRSEKSLMKHVLQRSGSRDVSAQLFTALCRALGIPARLVASLQSVPWQTNIGKAKSKPRTKKGIGKSKASTTISSEQERDEGDDESMEDIEVISSAGFPGDEQKPGEGSAAEEMGKGTPKPVLKLRKSRPAGKTLRAAKPPEPSDPLETPPVFWTEVFSKADGLWLPVDPIRAIVNKRKVFDPSAPSRTMSTPSRLVRVDNRLQYVLAFEEDGYVRDVTPRYAREYNAKILKAQAGGRGQWQWWEGVLGLVTRPYRLNRDDVEDEELTANRYQEAMPATMSGFKDHALYVLERHLRKDQVITPDTPELGKFRGEPVYARSSVLDLKAAVNWMRRGRSIRPGEQPLKWVKQRAVTISRKRELEVLKDMGPGASSDGAEQMQGLYAERQTEQYQAPPVIDGVIPKNDFGNIDLYTPSMLPQGAAHIPHRGTAKVARQLGFDFAEAVTGFEFKKGRAFPVITGIIVAAENEEPILEAYWEQEHTAAQKEVEKRQTAVIKRWTRLVQGLRLRARLQAQYGSSGKTRDESKEESNSSSLAEFEVSFCLPGGFLAQADDIVQAFHLPKNPYEQPQPAFLPEHQATGPLRSVVGTSIPEIRKASEEVEVLRPHHDDQPAEATSSAPPLPEKATVSTGVVKSLVQFAEEEFGAARTRDQGAFREPSGSAEIGDATAEDSNYVVATAQATVPSSSGRPRRAGTTKTKIPLKPKKRVRADVDLSPSDEEVKPEVQVKTRAAKRAKLAQVRTIPASDRVLRTRRGKDAAALKEEREREEALRQIVGDDSE
ncbi:hypothetical protein K488DRAFT_49600 [Vararia minispora EC-137]|uniref:Uncharacterized protein n=1 Tax=Vararia minispora EC-137 TaxID=1314806 RepID=A0ACB8QLJ4_9AGAM|nr:hypothetical protein K488DRAFT_49600 [Vararia minispora EC-137]